MRMRLTVVKEWEVDLEAYEDVEWPSGSGERKNLTEPADIAAYEQHQLDEGNISLEEILDLDDTGVTYKVEVVPYVQTEESAPEGSNPFVDDATANYAPDGGNLPVDGDSVTPKFSGEE